MQKVAAYLLERRDDMEWPAARAAEARRLKTEVEKWLVSKGASITGPAGTYMPEDGSTGTFKIEEAVDGDRSWWMVQLHEDTAEGRRFSVGIFIISAGSKVSVYIELETGWTTTQVMPVPMDPRCPKIVRNFLQLPGKWYHGVSTMHQRKFLSGFEDGEILVREIEHQERTVPIVVVSKRDGAFVLPELDSKLEYDLIGLANVFVLDDAASWALTDLLGSQWCCYWGAVRLFWPHFSPKQDRFYHPLWTAERLQRGRFDPIERRDRFRKSLRGLIFRAAALSVIKPSEIDDIRDAERQRILTELRERATSLEEYKKLWDSFVDENDRLHKEVTSLKAQVADLQEQVKRLEFEKQTLQAHLRAAKRVPEQVDSEDDMAADSDESPAISEAPKAGEVRFYKKVHSRPTHDVLVRVADCGCNRWESAHSADKARKGIAKLEGRDNWQSMQHCAKCTGGGMWRVRW
jgi:regulator of replication initiation timing